MTPSTTISFMLVSRRTNVAWAMAFLLLSGCPGATPTASIPITPAAQPAQQNDSPTSDRSKSASDSARANPSEASAANSIGVSEKSSDKREEAVASAAPVDASSPTGAGPDKAASGENHLAAAPAETKSEIAAVSKVANPGEVVPITFEDLNLNMQADIVFRPWMLTDRVKELEGKRVRLSGYMHGSVTQLKKIREFVMLKNTECKFGAGGQADHLINVKFQGDASASYTNTPVQVEGILKLNPYQGPDGNTWSVFDLLGENVKPARK